MVVLVDTNVIIDFLITIEPFYKASMEVVKMCEAGIGRLHSNAFDT